MENIWVVLENIWIVLASIFGLYVILDIIADIAITIVMKRNGMSLWDIAVFLRQLFKNRK